MYFLPFIISITTRGTLPSRNSPCKESTSLFLWWKGNWHRDPKTRNREAKTFSRKRKTADREGAFGNRAAEICNRTAHSGKRCTLNRGEFALTTLHLLRNKLIKCIYSHYTENWFDVNVFILQFRLHTVICYFV